MSDLKKKARNGIAWSLLDKVVNQSGNFILLIYLSRILSPSDFGLIAMLAIFLAVTQSLIDSGLSQALVQRSHKITQEDLSTVFFLNLTISIVLYSCLYFVAPYISTFYSQPDLVPLSRIIFIIIIINSFMIVPKAILTIAVDFKSLSIANTISTLISAIVAVYMVKNNYGYWSLVGMNMSRAFSIALLYFSLTRWLPSLIFSLESFKRLFSFGSKLLVAGLVATTVQNLYTVMIGRHFSASQVGYYQQGNNYTNILSETISSVVQGVTYPLMTSIQEDTKRLVEIYIKVMGVVTLITFPVFIGFMAIAEEFVVLFLGEKWISIVPILIILSFARMITPISVLNLNILNAKGRSDLFLKTDLAKLPLSIGALVVALPYGIKAIAIAQVVSVFISFFINAYFPGKLFGFGAMAQLRQIFPVVTASLVMFLMIYGIQLDSLWLQLILKVVLGAFVYFSVCKILKVKALDDIKKILNNR
jgi:teichuronic acid exporter